MTTAVRMQMGVRQGLTLVTSQLNLSQFWSLEPQLASTSQLILSRFKHRASPRTSAQTI